MKKLLSLIGTISLTTLSGISVVSCVIKTPSKPRFSTLLSITPEIWNKTKKEFIATDIVPNSNEQEITKESYLYYTILNSFKNPEEVAAYFDSNKVVYKSSIAEPVNGQENTNIIYLDLFLSDRNAIKVQNLAVTTYGNKTRLETKGGQSLSVTLTNVESNKIFDQLVLFSTNYRQLKNSNPRLPEKYILDNMRALDLKIKNQAIGSLEKIYLPAFDSEENILYETIGQQLSYLDDAYTEMNRAILLQLDQIIDTNKDSAIRISDIKDKINNFVLDNLTITLTK